MAILYFHTLICHFSMHQFNWNCDSDYWAFTFLGEVCLTFIFDIQHSYTNTALMPNTWIKLRSFYWNDCVCDYIIAIRKRQLSRKHSLMTKCYLFCQRNIKGALINILRITKDLWSMMWKGSLIVTNHKIIITWLQFPSPSQSVLVSFNSLFCFCNQQFYCFSFKWHMQNTVTICFSRNNALDNLKTLM